MRAWELNEMKVINTTSNEKQWVNPGKKQIVVVPMDMHHTQFAHMFPQKFGLSGNLFKDQEYSLNDEGKPELYDINIAKMLFDNGWARTGTQPQHISNGTNANIHSIDLQTAAEALRILKQKFNDLDSAIIDIGPDINPVVGYKLENDEFGKGPLRTFMRTGKIPVKENDVEEDIKARDVIGSAVRVDEIPKEYREKYEMIGRGATSLVYAIDEDWVLVFTRDKMKQEWLGTMGLELGDTIDELEVRGINRIKGMSDIPIYILKVPRLYKLSPENKRIVKKEVAQFEEIWRDLKRKYSSAQEILALHDLYNHYTEHLEDSLLYSLIEFVSNYDTTQFIFDMLQRNFMQDAQGDIVLVDPIVDRGVYNLIMDSKK